MSILKSDFKNPDLHMHSIYSDGTDDIENLLSKVKQSNVDVFSLTDHDSIDGCQKMFDLLTDEDPYFISGIELSCKDETGKYHILGYKCNPQKESINKAVEITHNVRKVKVVNRIKFLEEEFGLEFSKEEIKDILNNNNPGKPHIAKLLVNKGYYDNFNDAFNSMKNYKGTEFTLTPQEGIEAILNSDGIPVLAHGILADGSKNLSEEQITSRVVRLKDFGIMGLECFYSKFDDFQTKTMLSLAEKFNLMVTAGSDYHGANKSVKIGETNISDISYLNRFLKFVTF